MYHQVTIVLQMLFPSNGQHRPAFFFVFFKNQRNVIWFSSYVRFFRCHAAVDDAVGADEGGSTRSLLGLRCCVVYYLLCCMVVRLHGYQPPGIRHAMNNNARDGEPRTWRDSSVKQATTARSQCWRTRGLRYDMATLSKSSKNRQYRYSMPRFSGPKSI